MPNWLKELAGKSTDWGTIGSELRSGKRSPSDTLVLLDEAARKNRVSFGGLNPEAPFSPAHQKEALEVVGEAVLRAPLSAQLQKKLGLASDFPKYFEFEAGQDRRDVHASPASPWNMYFSPYEPLPDYKRLQSIGGSLIQVLGAAGIPVSVQPTELAEHLVTLGHLSPNVLTALRTIPDGSPTDVKDGDVFRRVFLKLNDLKRGNRPDDALNYWTTVLDAMSKPDYAMGWLKGEFGPAPK